MHSGCAIARVVLMPIALPCRTGPIHEVVLEAVRRNVRKQPVNIAAVNSYIRRNGGRTLLQDPFPRQVVPNLSFTVKPVQAAQMWETVPSSKPLSHQMGF